MEGVLIGAGVILEILTAVFHGADDAGPENIALGIFAFGGDALKGVARAHGEALGLDAGIGLKHGQHVFNHGSGQRAVQNQLAGSSGAVSAVAQATLRAMMAQRNKANSFFMDDSPFFICCFVEQPIQSAFIMVEFWKKFNRIFYLYIYIAKSDPAGKKAWRAGLAARKNAGAPCKTGTPAAEQRERPAQWRRASALFRSFCSVSSAASRLSPLTER